MDLQDKMEGTSAWAQEGELEGVISVNEETSTITVLTSSRIISIEREDLEGEGVTKLTIKVAD